MMIAARLLLVVALVAASAGCAAEGASIRNFDLQPAQVGWDAGEEAVFVLELTPTMLRSQPSIDLDRRFVLEEIHLREQGARFGGDFKTRNPDEVSLRLVRNGTTMEKVTLDTSNPSVELHLVLPEKLRDSQYVLELKLFQIGWVKSGMFRVDRP